jgi:hypothetical protein
MASRLKTIPEILDIARISQVLSANNVAGDTSGFGNAPDKSIHAKIYMERKAVEFLYEFSPSSEYTRAAADYLYAMCFPFNKEAEKIIENKQQAPPVVTGPSDLTVADGETASFTIAVTSALSYTIQWYRDGVLIPGATSLTYSFTATTGDNAAVFTAQVINAAGSALSQNGVLTVTTALVGNYYVGDTNYFANLSIGFDNVAYLGTFDIEEGEPLSISLPLAGDLGNNKNHVYRYPKSLGLYDGAWSNTPTNNGPQIPDTAFRTILEIGDYYYIVSRDEISVDVNLPMIFNL